ncbi:unnamed protein product [Urochloa humidicola]
MICLMICFVFYLSDNLILHLHGNNLQCLILSPLIPLFSFPRSSVGGEAAAPVTSEICLEGGKAAAPGDPRGPSGGRRGGGGG